MKKVIIFILLFIWQLPQNLLGLIMLLFVGKKTLLSKDNYISTFKGSKMSGGISLGQIAIVSESLSRSEEHIAHERDGHTYDSKLFGPLYLLVIGLPSLLWATFHSSKKCYYSFYTERLANKHAGLEVINSDSNRCQLRFISK